MQAHLYLHSIVNLNTNEIAPDQESSMHNKSTMDSIHSPPKVLIMYSE